MSWLTKVTDLAGKAENLLNQLDHNTAQALHKSPSRTAMSNTADEMYSSAMAAGREYASSDYGGTSSSTTRQHHHHQPHKSSGYASSVSSFVSKAKEDDEKLLAYLNEGGETERSRRSSTSSSHRSLPGLFQQQHGGTLNLETTDPPHDDPMMVEHQRRELGELHARDTDNRKSLQTKDGQLAVLRVRLQEVEQLLNSRTQQLDALKRENERLLRDSNDSNQMRNQALESLQSRLRDCETALDREKLHVKHLEADFRDRYHKLEEEKSRLTQEVTAAQRMVTEEKLHSKDAVDQLRLAKYNLEANKHEFDEYKQKAQRILQTKERLIDTMKQQGENGGSGEEHPGLAIQLEEMRAERDMIKDDLEQSQLMVYNLKADLQDLETQFAAEQRSALEQRKSLQEQCQLFQASASQYREQLEQLKLEYQYIQDELRRQQTAVEKKLHEKDAELVRLMNQSSTRALNITTSSEMEQRIRHLTENLIQKQTIIEALQTDKNSLSLQMERLERLYREAESAAIRSSSVSINLSGGDNEGISSRVPTFFRESPFDTGVARGAKKAYGAVDALSVRAGQLLRRYPTGRVFVFLYCLILHIWVFFVILTYTPEVHNNANAMMSATTGNL